MAAGKAWLDRFPPEWHGAVTNWFYRARRTPEAKAEPKALCSLVIQQLWADGKRWGPGGKIDQSVVIQAMRDDPAGALALAEWVIAREARPPEEKEREAKAEEQAGKQRHMERLAPTQKQLDTLLKLGVDVWPENRWHASQLIDEFREW